MSVFCWRAFCGFLDVVRASRSVQPERDYKVGKPHPQAGEAQRIARLLQTATQGRGTSPLLEAVLASWTDTADVGILETLLSIASVLQIITQASLVLMPEECVV